MLRQGQHSLWASPVLSTEPPQTLLVLSVGWMELSSSIQLPRAVSDRSVSRQAHLARGGLGISSCLPSRTFRQLKASLELPSAHHTACNGVCNARGSSALKPHSQPGMSPGICTFPAAATHPALIYETSISY